MSGIAAWVRRHWLAVVLSLPLAILWMSRMNGQEICCDAYDNLRMAVSLAHGGVMSLDTEPPFEPTMYREPLPPLLTAGLVVSLESFTGPVPFREWQQGVHARWLKYQNIFWMLLLYGGVYFVTWRMSGRRVVALSAGLAAQAIYLYSGMAGFGVNTLFTEIMATGMLVLASFWFAAALSEASISKAVFSGLLLGALTLTKAVFLPVVLVMVGVTPLLWWLARRPAPTIRRMAIAGSVLAGFVIAVGPWLIRDYVEFHQLKISDRGGYSLYTRALKDDLIWPEHYAGAFYAYTPNPLKPVVGAFTGNKPQDMLRGGSLQQFNRFDYSGFVLEDRKAMFNGRPDDAISYYYKGRAEWEKQKQRFRAAGERFPDLAADSYLTHAALAKMLSDPAGHAALVLPMLWRGALFTFPLLLVVAVIAWRRRDLWTFAFILPSTGMILFYAMVSNFEERYGVPAMPVALVAAVLLFFPLDRKPEKGGA